MVVKITSSQRKEIPHTQLHTYEYEEIFKIAVKQLKQNK